MESPPAPRSQRQQAIAVIRRWIEDRSFDADGRLPPERILAERLRMPRHSVRMALQQLEEEGLIALDGRKRVVRREAVAAPVSIADGALVILSDARETRGSTPYRGGATAGLNLGAIEAADAAVDEGAVIALYRERFTPREARQLVAERARGVVLIASRQDPEGLRVVVDLLAAGGVPCVSYAHAEEVPDGDTVCADHARGSALLVEALIARGCRRIRRIWEPAQRSWQRERDRGYEAAMRGAGLEPLPAIQPATSFSLWAQEQATYDAHCRRLAGSLVEILTGDEPADALLAPSDHPALGLVGAVALFAGLERRPLVAGYDDTWAGVAERDLAPRLPEFTIDKRNRAIGAALVELLLQRLAGELPVEPQHRLIAPRLVVPRRDEEPS